MLERGDNMKKELQDLKKLLVIVDMINGFTKEGSMADPYIQHTVPEQLQLIRQFQKEQEGIAFIRDCHTKGCREFLRFPEHCIDGTKESQIIDEFLPYIEEAMIYRKNSTSTMYAPNFLNDIEKMKSLKEIIVTGCCTDICVLNLAIPLQCYFDQLDRDVQITVPKDAVETFDAPTHHREEYNEKAFALMEQAGIQLVKRKGER